MSALGYRVGHKGLPAHQRRRILRRVVSLPFEELPKVDGVEEWGEADSFERLGKLANCLASFARTAHRRLSPPKEAIDDWESDLEWLQEGHDDEWVTAHFGPTTFVTWPSPHPDSHDQTFRRGLRLSALKKNRLST